MPSIETVSITATSNFPTAGEFLNVTCLGTITPRNLITGPNLTWIGPGVDQNTVQMYDGNSDKLTLLFSPLYTSDGGVYICNITLSIPEAGVYVSEAETTSITVQSKLLKIMECRFSNC